MHIVRTPSYYQTELKELASCLEAQSLSQDPATHSPQSEMHNFSTHQFKKIKAPNTPILVMHINVVCVRISDKFDPVTSSEPPFHGWTSNTASDFFLSVT